MDVMKIRTSKWGFREIDTGAIGVREQNREGLNAFKFFPFGCYGFRDVR